MKREQIPGGFLFGGAGWNQVHLVEALWGIYKVEFVWGLPGGGDFHQNRLPESAGGNGLICV